MPDFDDALDLLGAGPEVADEDGLAAENLPVTLDSEGDPPPPGRSWLFDMGSDRFVLHGSRPQETSGAATLIGWIDKYLHTQRGALPVHPDWFGMPDPLAIFGGPVSELSEAELLDGMQNMTNHPNIAEVTDARLTVDPLDEAALLEVEVLTDPPSEDVSLLTLTMKVGL